MPRTGLLFAQETSTVEYQLKAAFLFNFAKFVDWPPGAFPAPDAPINLCVIGHDPFGPALDELLRGKTINNRPLVPHRIANASELKGCHLVFISLQDEKQLPEILLALKGASSLLVGEAPDFTERGGAIQFFIENNKLRFAINVDAVQRAHLQASAKLLALAKIVHDNGNPKGN